MLTVTNAFSLNMLDGDTALFATRLTREQAARHLTISNFKSAVGHTDIANIMTSQLGAPVVYNRRSVELRVGDEILVGQYSGPRLPEGATQLPADAEIRYWLVEAEPYES